MYQLTRVCLLATALPLMACQSTQPADLDVTPQTGQVMNVAPPGAPEGSCWARDASPAVVETVTEQIEVQPAILGSEGKILSPAIYRTETRQQIVTPRQDTVFEIPCAYEQTPEFVASLQRALSARNLYRGNITGVMDGRTRGGVRRYQKPLGLDSGILSLASARSLGLVALERDPAQE
ncbi:MAG: peptidoglycan-binding protein [Roseovarius sp.]